MATLLSLPPEIRENIYSALLHPDANRVEEEDEYYHYNYAASLVIFRLNRQIYYESRKIFRSLNTFVRIETPWAEAQHHVQLEGHVPVVCSKDAASSFEGHSLNVYIFAPEHPMLNQDSQWFIILADDIPKFTRMWFYSNLTHPPLNRHLQLELELRDPYAPSYETPHLPKSLQRKLLLPFGEVKDLHTTKIVGALRPFPSLESDLRAAQLQPPASPEHCLQTAIRHKLVGNAALTAGRYADALAAYRAAWLAVHVVIAGHTRHIHADAFFNRPLRAVPDEPRLEAGRNGLAERVLLRVQLVANTCQVYLKMGDWAECAFWGMRSIAMMRDAMRPAMEGGVGGARGNGAVDGGRGDGEWRVEPREEAVLDFPGADQMGKVYYRTAVAMRELGDESEARKLLRVAEVYLPRDENVKKAIASVALRLG